MDEYTKLCNSLMEDVVCGMSYDNKNTILEKLDKLFKMVYDKNKQRLILKVRNAISQHRGSFTMEQMKALLFVVYKFQMTVTQDDINNAIDSLTNVGFSVFPEIDFEGN